MVKYEYKEKEKDKKMIEMTESRIESLLFGGAVVTPSGTLIENIERVDYDGINLRIRGWVKTPNVFVSSAQWYSRWATIRP
jgi:hypothetical protein